MKLLAKNCAIVQFLKWLKLFVQMGRVDGYNPPNSRKDTAFNWTDVYEKNPNSTLVSGNRRNPYNLFASCTLNFLFHFGYLAEPFTSGSNKEKWIYLYSCINLRILFMMKSLFFSSLFSWSIYISEKNRLMAMYYHHIS